MNHLPHALAAGLLGLLSSACATGMPAADQSSPALPAVSPIAADMSSATSLADAVATPRDDARASSPRSAAINGGVLVLPLPAGLSGHLYHHGQPVWTGRLHPNGPRVAVVGLGLEAEGEQTLSSDAAGTQPVLSFPVSRQSYPEQRLVLADSKYVTPAPEQLARFEREAAEQKAAYRVFTPAASTGAQWPEFRWPLVGRLSSPFGLRRYFNNEPRAPHLGLDIAGRTGALVVAPAAGRVALTGDYFFNGRTVIIDHGQGLFSMLCHFDKILVKAGDEVKAGQPVGQVGATGRATGPHLHWTVSLNDARVDPRWLLPGDAR